MKKKAEELDLENKAKHLQEAATHAAHQARDKAGELATDNRDKIDSALGKASTAIDQRTEGKYSDKIAKARDQINKGVDKVAEGDPAASEGADGGPGETASGSGGTMAEPVTSADSPTQSGVTPSSVNPPEVSQPQSGHPMPGAVPGAVPGPPPSAPKTPEQTQP
ncbi:hypothetical protein BA895_11215 [Humibacillus sp. DSM 29435]|nr:hypothetical protein BA895_11215 [Humibacillus sp. DSM 29435]